MSDIVTATQNLINTLRRGRDIITENGASCTEGAGFGEVIETLGELASNSNAGIEV